MSKLSVFSIFKSISGEVGMFPQGSITTFIRLAGCNVVCDYCDTPEALKMDSGDKMPVVEVERAVKRLGVSQVLITGGEPLIQQEGLLDLIDRLQGCGFLVQVETNGTKLISKKGPCWVVDYKTEGAKIKGWKMNAVELVRCLDPTDWVKFVCTSTEDFWESCEVIDRMKRVCPDALLPNTAFSPAGS